MRSPSLACEDSSSALCGSSMTSESFCRVFVDSLSHSRSFNRWHNTARKRRCVLFIPSDRSCCCFRKSWIPIQGEEIKSGAEELFQNDAVLFSHWHSFINSSFFSSSSSSSSSPSSSSSSSSCSSISSLTSESRILRLLLKWLPSSSPGSGLFFPYCTLFPIGCGLSSSICVMSLSLSLSFTSSLSLRTQGTWYQARWRICISCKDVNKSEWIY